MNAEVKENIIKCLQDTGRGLSEILVGNEPIVSTKNAKIADGLQRSLYELIEHKITDANMPLTTADVRRAYSELLIIKHRVDGLNEKYFDAFLDKDNEFNEDASIELEAAKDIADSFANVSLLFRKISLMPQLD